MKFYLGLSAEFVKHLVKEICKLKNLFQAYPDESFFGFMIVSGVTWYIWSILFGSILQFLVSKTLKRCPGIFFQKSELTYK